jgi:hypothetical protein
MCHLVTDASNDVQKMAYQMLRGAAHKRTEHVVLEAAVDTEGSYSSRLPPELIEIISQTIDMQEATVEVGFAWRQ